jgi:hypothetical protein
MILNASQTAVRLPYAAQGLEIERLLQVVEFAPLLFQSCGWAGWNLAAERLAVL